MSYKRLYGLLCSQWYTSIIGRSSSSWLYGQYHSIWHDIVVLLILSTKVELQAALWPTLAHNDIQVWLAGRVQVGSMANITRYNISVYIYISRVQVGSMANITRYNISVYSQWYTSIISRSSSSWLYGQYHSIQYKRILYI